MMRVARFGMTIVLVLACVGSLDGVLAEPPSPDLAAYTLDVAFDDVARTLDGMLSLDWPNTTGAAQSTLYFRLYPNADHYADGQTTVSSVTVGGAAASMALQEDETVLAVELQTPVGAGDWAHIRLAFETTVPGTSDAGFGILGGDPASGWWLADWHPILAGWESGTGWYLDPPTRFGDPTFAASATWELRLAAPDRYAVIGSGVEEEVGHDAMAGISVARLVSAPGRDLTLSLVPEAGGVAVTSVEAAGVGIDVTLPGALATPGLGEELAAVAGASLPLFEAWLGAYPDMDLDLVASPLAGTPAVAWNGIIWLDLAGVAVDGALSASEGDGLRFVLLHELAHQWIQGVIGSNNNDHGFMSEGLANTLAILAGRELYGAETAEAWLRERVGSGYLAMLDAGEDGIADAPITDATDPGDRARLVYGKAALGFEAIRQAIGDDAFFTGLQAYAGAYRFGIAEPVDLRAAWEAASGTALADLWHAWFEDDATTAADVRAVLDGFA